MGAADGENPPREPVWIFATIPLPHVRTRDQGDSSRGVRVDLSLEDHSLVITANQLVAAVFDGLRSWSQGCQREEAGTGGTGEQSRADEEEASTSTSTSTGPPPLEPSSPPSSVASASSSSSPSLGGKGKVEGQGQGQGGGQRSSLLAHLSFSRSTLGEELVYQVTTTTTMDTSTGVQGGGTGEVQGSAETEVRSGRKRLTT